MNMIRNWKDYIENFKSDEKILRAYKDLREFFMEEGWSEKDLENPPYYTKKMMRNREIINGGVIDLLHELRSFFGTVECNPNETQAYYFSGLFYQEKNGNFFQCKISRRLISNE